MYKLFVLVVVVFLAVQAHGDTVASVNKQACIRESSVNPSFVDKAENGDLKEARELKCYFKCYLQNGGYMNDKGEIQADKLRANIPSGINKTMANKAIDLCAVRKAADPKDTCETAYLVQKCLLENSLKY